MRRLHPFKPQIGQIELIHEHIDHLNWIVLVDPVVQAFRKKRGLATFNTLDEALHAVIPYMTVPESHRERRIKITFLHSQGH